MGHGQARCRKGVLVATAIVTGSCGLVGYETTKMLLEKGMHVIGIDNDMRGTLFGKEGSTQASRKSLMENYGQYEHEDFDIRHESAMMSIMHVASMEGDLELVVHTAGQPSHDWSAQAPLVDFEINASATLGLLEACRIHAPKAVFVYVSTNKVYGDWVNGLRLREEATRWEPYNPALRLAGVTESAPVDGSMHSPFGVSKLAGDLMTQEYGRYFGMYTACFRCGCITGGGHRGVKLHGFLAYLAKCVKEGLPYTVLGYHGKQVRDNLHAQDLASAFWEFYQDPKKAAVYNMGGGYDNSCSILEAIMDMTKITGHAFDCEVVEEARLGDHKWWISNTGKFESEYPNWRRAWDLESIHKALLA